MQKPAGSGGCSIPASSAGQGRSGMDFSKLDGLVPAVIQDARSHEVLMVGFMNDEALAHTRATGFATFYSRSRQALWTKGETSDNRLKVVELFTDCDHVEFGHRSRAAIQVRELCPRRTVVIAGKVLELVASNHVEAVAGPDEA